MSLKLTIDVRNEICNLLICIFKFLIFKNLHCDHRQDLKAPLQFINLDIFLLCLKKRIILQNRIYLQQFESQID